MLAAAPELVWEALTTSPQLSEWFGARVEMEPRRGGRVLFRFPGGEVRRAVVEVFEPPRVLVLRWLPFAEKEGRVAPARMGRIDFRLDPDGPSTRLTVVESASADLAMSSSGGRSD